MSEYGSIDKIKTKIRDNVLKTNRKMLLKTRCGRISLAFLKKWMMTRRSSFRSLPALSAGPGLLMNGPERAGLHK